MSSMQKRLFKERLVELIKYDFNTLKFPIVAMAYIAMKLFQKMGKHDKAFSLASSIYRTGWSGSYGVGLGIAKYYFLDHKELGKEICQNMIDNIPRMERTDKFFDDPKLILNGVINVIKPKKDGEKGALVLKYSYYFPLLFKLYDVDEIQKHYHIIIEPSWAGFCELGILIYSTLEEPVFVQTYESRDKRFINELNINLITMDVGPSWFVNHENFIPSEPEEEKDIDIIMVAAWAGFKRHHHFFKALAQLKAKGKKLNVALVGYPTEQNREYIEELLQHHDIQDLATIYEWIEPHEVAALFKRAKINILWSKFEGNNRAIIEGMFCGTPGIMREGHNYGDKYDFINSQTGRFANDGNLASTIESMLADYKSFTPRDYVMKNRNCITAADRMNEVVKNYETQRGRPWTGDFDVKINELNCMRYLNEESDAKFKKDHDFLAEFIKK